MDVRELMCNDWVVRRYSTGETENARISNTDFLYDTNKVKYEGIPLTENMLNNNGFKHPWGRFAYYYQGQGILVHCGVNGEPPFTVNIAESYKLKVIKYVHELQHVLRLCGMGDLADNFIVTDNESN